MWITTIMARISYHRSYQISVLDFKDLRGSQQDMSSRIHSTWTSASLIAWPLLLLLSKLIVGLSYPKECSGTCLYTSRYAIYESILRFRTEDVYVYMKATCTYKVVPKGL